MFPPFFRRLARVRLTAPVRRRIRLDVERLEDRRLLTTDIWTGAAFAAKQDSVQTMNKTNAGTLRQYLAGATLVGGTWYFPGDPNWSDPFNWVVSAPGNPAINGANLSPQTGWDIVFPVIPQANFLCLTPGGTQVPYSGNNAAGFPLINVQGTENHAGINSYDDLNNPPLLAAPPLNALTPGPLVTGPAPQAILQINNLDIEASGYNIGADPGTPYLNFNLAQQETFNGLGGGGGYGGGLEGAWPEVANGSVSIASAGNGPIFITSTAALGPSFVTNSWVFINGVQGNINPNGNWQNTQISGTVFELDGSNANGTSTANTGTWADFEQPLLQPPKLGAALNTVASDVVAGASGTGGLITITTPAADAGTFASGDWVTISGITGFNAANGTFQITKTSSTTFTLNGTSASGTGTVTSAMWFDFGPGKEGVVSAPVQPLYVPPPPPPPPPQDSTAPSEPFFDSSTNQWVEDPPYDSLLLAPGISYAASNYGPGNVGQSVGTMTEHLWALNSGSPAAATVELQNNLTALDDPTKSPPTTWPLSTNNGTSTFAPNIILTQTNQSFQVIPATATLVLSGTISDSAQLAALGGNTAFVFNGGTDQGILELSGINTYTGKTEVQSGILRIDNDLALGSTISGTIVANGATLWLDGVTVTNEALTLNGDGFVPAGGSPDGALEGWGIWQGGIVLGGGGTLDNNIGPTTAGLSTTIQPFFGPPDPLILEQGTTNPPATITGPGDLNVIGFGTLVLNSANFYNGKTTVNADATLLLENNTSLSNNHTVLNGGAGPSLATCWVGSGATLALDNNITVSGITLTLNGDGVPQGGLLPPIGALEAVSSTINEGFSASVASDLLTTGAVIVPDPIASAVGDGTNDITITSINNLPPGFATGAYVTITGVQGFPAVNGTFQVTVPKGSLDTFTLDGTAGSTGTAVADSGSWTQTIFQIASSVGNGTSPIAITTNLPLPTVAGPGFDGAPSITIAGVQGFPAVNGEYFGGLLNEFTATGTNSFTVAKSSLGTGIPNTGSWSATPFPDVPVATKDTWAGPIILASNASIGADVDAESSHGFIDPLNATDTIVSATGTPGGPITIVTSNPLPAGLVTGSTVSIAGVGGGSGFNTFNINSTFQITLTGTNTFTLNGTNGITGSGTGGSWDASIYEDQSVLTLPGALTNSNQLTKVGPGVLVLPSDNGGTFTGTTVVNDGIVVLQNGNALGAAAADSITVNNNSANNTAGTVEVEGGTSATNTVTVNNALSINGFGYESEGALDIIDQNATTPSYVTWAGPISLGNSSGSDPVGAPTSISVDPTPSDTSTPLSTLIISGPLTGAADVTLEKDGQGTMILQAASPNWLGHTTVRLGVLEIQNALALGPGGTSNLNNITSVGITGTLEIGGSLTAIPETLVLEGPGYDNLGALYNPSGTSEWSGQVTLSGTAPVTINVAGGQLTLDGVLAGSVGLLKAGTGALVLGGTSSNTASGTTTVTAGTLYLAKNTSPGTGNPNALALNGPLVIGDEVGTTPDSAEVVFANNNQITSSQLHDASGDPIMMVTVNPDGALDLNGFMQAIGSLFLVGGDVGLATDILVNMFNSGAKPPLGQSGTLVLGTSGQPGELVSDSPHNSGLDAALPNDRGASIKGTINGGPGTGILSLGPAVPTVTVAQDPFLAAGTPDLNVAVTVSGNTGVGLTTTASTNINTVNALDTIASIVGNGAGPITITSTNFLPAGLTTGTNVTLFGVQGAWTGPTGAAFNINQTFDVTVTGPDQFTLDNTNGFLGNSTTGAWYAVTNGTEETITGNGTLQLAAADTYSGPTTVNSGTVQAAVTGALPDTPLVINGTAAQSATVTVLDRANETVSSLTGNSFSSLNLLGSATLTAGGDNSSTVFAGTTSGTGTLAKIGTGTLQLTGNGTGFTGTVAPEDGVVLVTGGGDYGAATFALDNTDPNPLLTPLAYLGGNAAIPGTAVTGGITVNNSATNVVVDPGSPSNSPPGLNPGIINANGSVTFNANTTYGVDITGTSPGTGYSQLNTTNGAVTLGNALLAINTATVPTGTNLYQIINSDGPVSGTFGNVNPINNTITVTVGGNPASFVVSYNPSQTGAQASADALGNVTITLPASNPALYFTQGDWVTISGFANNLFNGTFQITNVITPGTKFTVSDLAAAGQSPASGGTATIDSVLLTSIASTTTTVSLSSTATSTYGSTAETLKATVSPVSAGSSPTGTVKFYDGGINGTLLGTVTTSMPSGSSSVFTLSNVYLDAAGTPPAGPPTGNPHNDIIAVYSGQLNVYGGSTSAPASSVTVNYANVNSTSLTPPATTASFGSPVTFTVTLSSTVNAGASAPTGTVSFFDNTPNPSNTPFATITATPNPSGPPTVTSTGTGVTFTSYTTPSTGVAVYEIAVTNVPYYTGGGNTPQPQTIVAKYAGDQDFNSSTSNTVQVTVNPGDVTVGLTESYTPPLYYGGLVTLTATVTPSVNGSQAPDVNGDYVQFTDESGAVPIILGQPQTTGGATGAATVTLVVQDGVTSTPLHPGVPMANPSDLILATFHDPDGFYQDTTSPQNTSTDEQNLPTVLAYSSMTTIFSSGNPLMAGANGVAPVTFTVQVTAPGSGATPTGTVNVTINGSTIVPGATLDGNGEVSFSTTLAAGNYFLTASYTSNSGEFASTPLNSPATFSQTVQALPPTPVPTAAPFDLSSLIWTVIKTKKNGKTIYELILVNLDPVNDFTGLVLLQGLTSSELKALGLNKNFPALFTFLPAGGFNQISLGNSAPKGLNALFVPF
jgi:fibronectin-binding autotransporter adhesin